MLIWFAVAVPSLLQIWFPGLETAWRRDPDAVRLHGQAWRLLTSVLVQDSGIGGTVFNLIILAATVVFAGASGVRPGWSSSSSCHSSLSIC